MENKLQNKKKTFEYLKSFPTHKIIRMLSSLENRRLELKKQGETRRKSPLRSLTQRRNWVRLFLLKRLIEWMKDKEGEKITYTDIKDLDLSEEEYSTLFSV